jgi:glycosyltransferase involved in cell wall biosynthesis
MYNIMAAGKPIIAVTDENSELALVVKEENIGWVVPPGDVDRIIDVILLARTDRTLLKEMGHRARVVAENKYSFERVLIAYRDLITGL